MEIIPLLLFPNAFYIFYMIKKHKTLYSGVVNTLMDFAAGFSYQCATAIEKKPSK